MHNNNRFITTAAFLAALSGAAVAGPITVAPTTPPSSVPATCTTDSSGGNDIAAFLVPVCGAPAGIDLLYKQDVPTTESGPLAASYATTFNADLSGGTISWTAGTPSADCLTGTCWLVVKDGNHSPARYGYNLSTIWDGISTITLSGFWPAGGSISHVALYGFASEACTEPGGCGPDRVLPEPGTLALAGGALVGLAALRRRRGA